MISLGTKKLRNTVIIQAPSMQLMPFTVKRMTNTILTYSLMTALHDALR